MKKILVVCLIGVCVAFTQNYVPLQVHRADLTFAPTSFLKSNLVAGAGVTLSVDGSGRVIVNAPTTHDFTNATLNGTNTLAASQRVQVNFTIQGDPFWTFNISNSVTTSVWEWRDASGAVWLQATQNQSGVAAALFVHAPLILSRSFGVVPANVTLTADNQTVSTTNRSTILLTSDSGTATDRTFILTPGTFAGQELTVVWGATGSGELLDDSAQATSGNHRLTANMTFGANDVLKLIFNGTDWLEVSRAAN